MSFLLLSAALFLPAQNVSSVAMVLTTKGKATLERGNGLPRRLGAMGLLLPGDRVQVAEDGEVVLVFLLDGQRERLKPKAKVIVKAKGCQPADTVERLPQAKLSAANLESLRGLVNSSRGAVGVPRGDPPSSPQVVTPLYGASVLTERPTLTWPAAKADAYLVELFDSTDNKKPLWRATVKETRLPYPAKEKPLEEACKYRWRVTPLQGEDASAEPIVNSYFQVLTQEEITLLAELKPLLAGKSAADLLLAAVSYETHGVYDEALRLYERLAEMSPGEANFQTTLEKYYVRAGRKDLAAKANERAKQLTAEK